KSFLRVQDEFGSFDAYVWRFVKGTPKQNRWRSHAQLPAHSPESDALSKDLKRRGFRFVGSTICYAFMQATGMVNDHTVDCFRYAELAPCPRPDAGCHAFERFARKHAGPSRLERAPPILVARDIVAVPCHFGHFSHFTRAAQTGCQSMPHHAKRKVARR